MKDFFKLYLKCNPVRIGEKLPQTGPTHRVSNAAEFATERGSGGLFEVIRSLSDVCHLSLPSVYLSKEKG